MAAGAAEAAGGSLRANRPANFLLPGAGSPCPERQPDHARPISEARRAPIQGGGMSNGPIRRIARIEASDWHRRRDVNPADWLKRKGGAVTTSHYQLHLINPKHERT